MDLSSFLFFLLSFPTLTHQPDHQSVVAHVGGGMQGAHPIPGLQVDVCTAVLHQKLHQMQMALLTGQVKGRGSGGHLLVHTPAGNVVDV